MEFIVDKENRIVHVKRQFDAPQASVWAAWTEPDLLDQWWAPEPFTSKTKSMEFKEGGRRLYAMLGPNGEEHWAVADYTSITPKTNFKLLDGFCDESGRLNEDMPRSKWNIDFTESNGTTTVQVEIKHKTLENLEALVKMGFKEGFTAGLNQLDKLLISNK